jgi:CRP-like cAMP-binding protein
MNAAHSASGGRSRNRLLSALSPADYGRLEPQLEPVSLATRDLLFDVGEPITHVYFIESAVGSVLGVMADGTAVETATVGREGMVGIPVFLGSDRTSAQAFCQVAGDALRMESGAFRAHVAASAALRDLLNRYTQALFTQVAQSSACNRVHAMEQRCARWLLQTHDRVGVDSFPLAQQFLAQMLGVRRATVTVAAGALERVGLITYRQGVIRIVDRAGLEHFACECYAIIAHVFARLVEGISTPDPLAGLVTAVGGKSLIGPPRPRGDAIPDAEAAGDPAA